jgi:hypothetical protein
MINKIINELDFDTLKNFVLEYAKENAVFRNRLEVKFSKLKFSEDSNLKITPA